VVAGMTKFTVISTLLNGHRCLKFLISILFVISIPVFTGINSGGNPENNRFLLSRWIPAFAIGYCFRRNRVLKGGRGNENIEFFYSKN